MIRPSWPQLLDTKQVLGEHLFSKVSELHREAADRITGMLLETDNEEIMRMLEDATLLRHRIEGALRVIGGENQRMNEKEKYGEQLYQLVSEIEPIQCAKITGMLLELETDAICHLISSPTDLQKAVQKSLKSLRADCRQREELGEQLYRILSCRFDADSAAKLTGMLLEMEDDQLSHLIQDKVLLEEKIRLASEALLHQTGS